MSSYKLCKYYLNANDEIIEEWQKSDDYDCIDESLEMLCDIINKICCRELNLLASAKFIDSFHSIHILYENNIIERDVFIKLSLNLLEQIIEDMKKFVKYQESQMKEGE